MKGDGKRKTSPSTDKSEIFGLVIRPLWLPDTNPAQAERALIAILVNPAQLRGKILGRPSPGL
jgi:hypothetical protein